MSPTGLLLKKALKEPSLGLAVFDVAVLDKYLAQSGTSISRTNTVGRLKTATWTIDFGIAPDEATLHLTLGSLAQKLPEAERDHWLEFADGARFSDNFAKMQASHACIDDGNLRAWGEAAGDSLFD